jgi:hypothetical protein
MLWVGVPVLLAAAYVVGRFHGYVEARREARRLLEWIDERSE